MFQQWQGRLYKYSVIHTLLYALYTKSRNLNVNFTYFKNMKYDPAMQGRLYISIQLYILNFTPYLQNHII